MLTLLCLGDTGMRRTAAASSLPAYGRGEGRGARSPPTKKQNNAPQRPSLGASARGGAPVSHDQLESWNVVARRRWDLWILLWRPLLYQGRIEDRRYPLGFANFGIASLTVTPEFSEPSIPCWCVAMRQRWQRRLRGAKRLLRCEHVLEHRYFATASRTWTPR